MCKFSLTDTQAAFLVDMLWQDLEQRLPFGTDELEGTGRQILDAWDKVRDLVWDKVDPDEFERIRMMVEILGRLGNED